MRWPLALLVPLLTVAHPARAQMVESAFSVVLTAKRTVSGPAGDRMQLMRIGTKDVIDRFRQALGGISGRSVRLVVQRSIEDLAFRDACEFLVVDGTYYEVGGTSESIEMPASFYGSASSSARRPGGLDLSFTQEAVGLFRMRDAFSGHGEFAFSALARRSARLLTQQGIHLGYVHTRLTWSVSGGLADVLGVMPVSGTLMLGPETVVTVPDQPCGG